MSAFRKNVSEMCSTQMLNEMLQVTKLVIRHLAFHEEKRVDGRALDELRPITCQVTFVLISILATTKTIVAF